MHCTTQTNAESSNEKHNWNGLLGGARVCARERCFSFCCWLLFEYVDRAGMCIWQWKNRKALNNYENFEPSFFPFGRCVYCRRRHGRRCRRHRRQFSVFFILHHFHAFHQFSLAFYECIFYAYIFIYQSLTFCFAFHNLLLSLRCRCHRGRRCRDIVSWLFIQHSSKIPYPMAE